jgi:hypothetical protein
MFPMSDANYNVRYKQWPPASRGDVNFQLAPGDSRSGEYVPALIKKLPPPHPIIMYFSIRYNSKLIIRL